MGFKAFLGSNFDHTHENQAFNRLHDLLKQEWTNKNENLYLLGNFFANGKEFDALIIKRNAIIVIDFKNYGGKVEFSENGNWKCNDIIVKGCSYDNPFKQIKTNKFSLIKYIEDKLIKSDNNWGHISGLVIFQDPITLEANQMPHKIKSWFNVCYLDKSVRTINEIASNQINLRKNQVDSLIDALNISEYYPDGRDNLYIVEDREDIFGYSQQTSPSDDENSSLYIKNILYIYNESVYKKIGKENNYNNIVYTPNHACKIGIFKTAKTIIYDEHDKGINNIIIPNNFKEKPVKLKALYYHIYKEFEGTNWKIHSVENGDYNELYTFINKKNEYVNVKLTYRKGVWISDITYTEEKENPDLVNEVKKILEKPKKIKNKEKALSVPPVRDFFEAHGFSILNIEDTRDSGVIVTIQKKEHKIEVKYWVNSSGAITKFYPQKSSTPEGIEILKNLFN